jgi:hypothetical protein
MPICKLCGEDAKLIDAHVIPRAFYGRTEPGAPGKIISSVAGRHPKRVPKGIYDQGILCEKCDGMLGQLDQHAAETLLPGGMPVRLTPLGEPICYIYEKADPLLIHRFTASVLWRASVSDNLFFGRVRLGPYEPKIARLLLEPGLAPGEGLETTLGEFDASHVPILDPHTIKMNGARYWVVYANRFSCTSRRTSARAAPRYLSLRSGPVCRSVRSRETGTAARNAR